MASSGGGGEQSDASYTSNNVVIDNGHNAIKLHTIDNSEELRKWRKTSQDGNAPPLVPPATLLIHGLDSSSHTWRRTLKSLAERGCPAVAVDCRGCGLSELGDDVADFTVNHIVADIHHVMTTHPMLLLNPNNKINKKSSANINTNETLDEDDDNNISNTNNKVVVVGHSMGGRIAMSYAAAHFESRQVKVAALVVEDMDIGRRVLSVDSPIAKTADRQITLNFQRKFETFDTFDTFDDSNTDNRQDHVQDVLDRFEAVEYPAQMVQGWLDEGRIRLVKCEEENNSNESSSSYYYSDVNPAFRRLCYEQFFDNADLSLSGVNTWNQIAIAQQQHAQDSKSHTIPFPCHVMVASDEGTVCTPESIATMTEIMADHEQRLHIHRYPAASHSIHNTAHEAFINDLTRIIYHDGTVSDSE
jgi:pimeloyl-ACP methyl ester carboxylesterase